MALAALSFSSEGDVCLAVYTLIGELCEDWTDLDCDQKDGISRPRRTGKDCPSRNTTRTIEVQVLEEGTRSVRHLLLELLERHGWSCWKIKRL